MSFGRQVIKDRVLKIISESGEIEKHELRRKMTPLSISAVNLGLGLLRHQGIVIETPEGKWALNSR